MIPGRALLRTLPFVALELLSTMPGFIHEGRFLVEMLLCEKTNEAFIKRGKVEWYDPEDKEGFRCDAPDPRTFPRRAGEDKSDLPFKYIGDTEDDHLIAGEGYRRTQRPLNQLQIDSVD